MDHCRRVCGDMFSERLWRAVRYGNAFPQAYGTPKEAGAGSGDFLEYRNTRRPHYGLGTGYLKRCIRVKRISDKKAVKQGYRPRRDC